MVFVRLGCSRNAFSTSSGWQGTHAQGLARAWRSQHQYADKLSRPRGPQHQYSEQLSLRQSCAQRQYSVQLSRFAEAFTTPILCAAIAGAGPAFSPPNF
eukprot:4040380-Amphidinium_carterae.1